MKKVAAAFSLGLVAVFTSGQDLTLLAQAPAVEALEQAASNGSAFVPEGLERSDDPTEGRLVIGRDDRAPLLSRSYPWSTIGRLEVLTPSGAVRGHCTGSLIGRDLVLTNAHCALDANTRRPNTRLRFRPNLIGGKAETSAMVVAMEYGTDFSDGGGDRDWALLKLDRPLGDRYGWLGWLAIRDYSDLSWSEGKINLAGYSGDFPADAPGETPSVHLGCSLRGVREDGRILHDCDTMPGASGSPLLGKFADGNYYVLGLHTSGISEAMTGRAIANLAIPVVRWAQAAQELLGDR